MQSPPRRSDPKVPRVLSIGIAVVLGLMVWTAIEQILDSADESPYSVYSRHQLETNWRGSENFPIVLPERMPPGAREHDEVGFSLWGISVDPDVSSSKRVWVYEYSSDVLGTSGFRVFQRPSTNPSDRPCGPMGDVPYLERPVPGGTLTVCSKDLRQPDARRYWTDVPLTSQLEDVNWLVD